jgi:hypothetical protein
VAAEPAVPEPEARQLELFTGETEFASVPAAPKLPELVPIPPPPLYDVRKLSYTALALFERCSYRFFAERVAGMRERAMRGEVATGGLGGIEVGDAVHRLLELVDLTDPRAPDDCAELVREWYPRVSEEAVALVRAHVESYCGSDLARRLAAEPGVAKERHFTFLHDGVILHGFLDVLALRDERALVVDYKTNALADVTPEELVDSDYRLQRLVYALACFRAGAAEVEVVYAFLERTDAVVATTFTTDEVPQLEAELSAAIARIRAGEFVPTPSELACSTCPVLDLVCAGPRLRSAARRSAAPA